MTDQTKDDAKETAAKEAAAKEAAAKEAAAKEAKENAGAWIVADKAAAKEAKEAAAKEAKENAGAWIVADKAAAKEAKEAAAKEAEWQAERKADRERRVKAERTINELLFVDEYLEAHGLTISDLLRTVAKNFHGISIPLYVEPVEEKD